MGSVVKLHIAVLLMAVLVGCGGGSSDPPSAVVPATLSPAAGSISLTPPVDVLANLADRTSSALLLRTGNSFEPGLAQHVAVEATGARFNPGWTGGPSTFGDLAYAVYSFDVQTYFGVEEVRLIWGEEPGDYANLWIGLGNWVGNCWDWYPGSQDGILNLENIGYGDYTEPGTGNLLVAVVLTGDVPALLDNLQVGETEQSDWWMFGRDPRHTRRSPYVGAQTNDVKWSFTAAGSSYTAPAFDADGTLYIGVASMLYAIEPNGMEKWSYATGNDVESSPAIGMDGTIYVGSRDRKLHAVNPDGSLKWAYTAGDYVLSYSSPAIGPDGTVYVGSWDKKLHAVNPDGTQKWAYTTTGYINSSPAIGADGTVYVGSYDYNLYAINPDGSLKWSYLTEGNIFSSPAIGSDGTIYLGSNDDKLHAINPDGTKKWWYLTGGFVMSSPGIGADGTVYVGSNDGMLYAIYPNGNLRWTYTTAGDVRSSPAIGADGTVYVGSWDTRIHAVNPNGTEKWASSFGVSVSSPAIGADGTLYVGTSGDRMYAFGPIT